jgi:hypothetical protein
MAKMMYEFNTQFVCGSRQMMTTLDNRHKYQAALVPILFPVIAVPVRYNTRVVADESDSLPECIPVGLYEYAEHSRLYRTVTAFMFKTEFDALRFLAAVDPVSVTFVDNVIVK